MKRSAQYLCLILICTSGLPACASPLTYSAEPIEAWVVDAATKKPLEGVIVTANWQLVEGTLGGSRPLGQLKVMEAVTDKNGRFAFPAWGPIEVTKGHLVSDDPQLLLFKSGYQYLRFSNQYTSDRELRLRPVRRSEWSGKTIELKPFKGTIDTYENQFESLNRDLERFAADKPEECGWKKIPNTIRAMNQERKRLVALGVNTHTLSSLDKELLMNDEYYTKKGGCGSPKAFFEDLQR